MALTIVPFDEAHLDGACGLLAARQARSRRLEPVLPAGFETAAAVRAPLEELFRSPGAGGVIALRDGEAAGFVLASARLPQRVMIVPYHGLALAEGERPELLRELYASLADDWVRRGYFTHWVAVLDKDAAGREVWDSLGFGRELTAAVRKVAPPLPDAPELDVRAAGVDELDVIAALEDANARHHNTAPVFNPYLSEDRLRYRLQTEELLKEPVNAHFVAFEDGQPVGMNTFMSSPWLSPLVKPEKSIYLYQGVVFREHRGAGIGRGLLAHSLRWARDQGFDYCTLHYFSANIVGARFWQAAGFRPFQHHLSRIIDGRVAWAHP